MTLTPEQQQLAEEYVDLAHSQAWNFVGKCAGKMSVDDAKSAAMLGLVQAVEAYPGYCERNGFDPSADGGSFFRAYALRRIRGSVLDEARSIDHMSRADRKLAKQLRAAEDDGHRGDDELAAATGIDPAVVRRIQADAMVTLSLQDQDLLTGTDYAASVADDSADTESQAAVSDILGGVVAAFDALTAEIQVVLALRYHAELEPGVIAKELRTSEQRVRELHDAGVLKIHQAMLRRVQGEGAGPRQPARVEIAAHIRSADCCSAAELAAVTAGKRCNDCLRWLPVETFSWRNRALGYRVPYCPPCASTRAGAAYAKRKAARIDSGAHFRSHS